MLGQELGVDALEPRPILRLVLLPAVRVGGQVRLEFGEDQFDVKASVAVIDEVLPGNLLPPRLGGLRQTAAEGVNENETTWFCI